MPRSPRWLIEQSDRAGSCLALGVAGVLRRAPVHQFLVVEAYSQSGRLSLWHWQGSISCDAWRVVPLFDDGNFWVVVVPH